MNKSLLLSLALVCSTGILSAQQNKVGKQKLTLSTAQAMDPAKRSPSLQNLKYVNLGQKPSNKVSSAAASFFEDFDGVSGTTSGGAGTYTFAPNFLLRNVDAKVPDAMVSYVNEAWERREDFSNAVTDSAAFSTSFYSPFGAANDFMWTPLVSGITANSVLSWNAVTYDPLYQDGYEVRIMTVAPTGGSGVIGNQLTNSTSVFSIAAENSTWTGRTLSLAAYAGQSIYIGFRNNSNDKFLLLIDDIKVEEIVAIDAQVISVDTVSQYTGIPLKQKANLTLGGKIRNNGTAALNSVSLKVDVRDATNAIVATFTSAPVATIASGAIGTFTIPNVALPNIAGSYTFKFNPVLAAQVDQVPNNDTLAWTAPFNYTQNEYSRDNGIVTGGLGIGAGNGGFLGQEFNIVNSDILKAVSARFTKGYTGRKLAALIYNTLPNGAPNIIVAKTDTLLYLDDSARTYTLPIKGGFAALPVGRYVVAAIEFDSTLQLANTNSIFTTKRIWVNWPTIPGGNWANVETFGVAFSKPFVLRPQFGKIAGDDVCDAITLTAGANGPYRHDLASAQVGEVLPPTSGGTAGNQTAWYNDGTGVTNSMWFKFIATTKKVRIQTNWGGEYSNDTQIALWKTNTNSCGDLLSAANAILLAANDDTSTTYFGSLINGSTLCLAPGTTYYLQVDAYRANLTSANVGDSLNVIFQPIADVVPSISGLNAAYCVGIPAVTLVGTPSGGVFSVNNTVSATYTPVNAGVDSVKYTVGTCFITNQTITVNDLPIVTASASAPVICAGQSTVLTGGGAATYGWNNGATNGAAISPSGTTSYTVTGTDANTCSNTATVTVTVNALPIVTANASNDTICAGQSTVLTGGGAVSYTWNNGATNGVTISPIGTTTYTVTGTDANTCSNTATQTITVNANPVASLTAPTATLCTGTPATLTGLPSGGIYSVVSGSASALVGNTFNAATIGPYTIAYTSTNAAGCSDSAQFNFNVNCVLGIDNAIISNSSFIVIPNPNNGVFTISSNIEIDGTIELINELGQVVYKKRMNGLVKNIDIQNIAAGIYHLKVSNGYGFQIKRLSIIK